MTVAAPSWWQFALLALAAFRVYRLLARDSITEPLRAAVSMPDDQAVTLGHASGVEVAVSGNFNAASLPREPPPKTARVYAATLIRCPWCLGAYVSVAAWVAWDIAPAWTTFLAVPLALSAVLGLAAKVDH